MNKMVWCCLSLCGAGKNLGDGNLRGRLESTPVLFGSFTWWSGTLKIPT